MKPELEAQLKAINPAWWALADDPHQPMSFGLCVGDGWFPILKDLFEVLQHHAGRWPEVVEIKQRILEEKWEAKDGHQCHDEKFCKTIVVSGPSSRGVLDKHDNMCCAPDGHYPQWIHDYFSANPTNPWVNFRLEQVKEKFAGLRFYTSGGDGKVVSAAVAMAEAACWRTCEQCGLPGEPTIPRDGGWRSTLCPSCAGPDRITLQVYAEAKQNAHRANVD